MISVAGRAFGHFQVKPRMPVRSREEVLARLCSGDGLVVAEGYLFEFQKRGYLKAGAFVPEVVLEHPELVRNLHHEFVHAGSDVVLAFTFYAHREKMRLIGREDDLPEINKKALEIARQVADETDTLMAGDLCNTTIYKPNDPDVEEQVWEMFKEQIEWVIEGKADYIVVENMTNYPEAKLALDAVLKYGKGLPVVVTFTQWQLDPSEDLVENCRKIEEAGADVVGLNCGGGPVTTLPIINRIRQVCKGPIACLPACYRTTAEHPMYGDLMDIDNPKRSAYPIDLDAWLVTVTQVRTFARQAWDLGVRYLGLCCGNRAHYTRALVEEIGRTPPASRYSTDMSQHFTRMKDQAYDFQAGRSSKCSST